MSLAVPSWLIVQLSTIVFVAGIALLFAIGESVIVRPLLIDHAAVPAASPLSLSPSDVLRGVVVV